MKTATQLQFFTKEARNPYMETGWGNGYLVIPKGHKLHGMGYDDIHDAYDISVNGGLTFAESAKGLKEWGLPDFVKDSDWIIGFDTAHYGDTRSRWPDEQSILNECKRLANQIEDI